MEMRAKEDIEIGTDITLPLPPLAISLYDSSLSSHCSSCFLSLSSTTSTSSLHYCSTTCSTSTSTSTTTTTSSEQRLLSLLHSNPSLYPHPDSSDLRLSLRLLHLLSPSSSSLSPRLLRLLTNRHHLTCHDDDGVMSSKVKAGANAIVVASRGFRFDFDSNDRGFQLEEAVTVLCLVITNAVEISLYGQRLGIGVYDWRFSWINHTCSPNSCFRFLPALPLHGGYDDSSSMRIFPCGDHAQMQQDEGDSTTSDLANGVGNYGPRLIVRSIKGIQSGEEVTITYTDLLQPTETICLGHENCSKTLDKHNKEEVTEKLRYMLDNTIAEYMELGDPVSCCEKVEKLLSGGCLNHVEQTRGIFHIYFKLLPLHYISLSAFTTLISTYKIRAGFGEMRLQSVDMRMISAAYSLLLAGATHHLFMYEPSLIVSAATFWIDAGESLLCVGRSPSWNSCVNSESQHLSDVHDVNCPRCLLMHKFESSVSSGQTQNKALEDISQEFHKCISIMAPKVWSFLIQDCKYLKSVKDPIDFSWIRDMSTFGNTQYGEFHFCHESENKGLLKYGTGNAGVDARTDILRLGVHCLQYGRYLSSICYGNSCSNQLVRHVIHI
ncbi:protein SET DOMAIN GROUP 41 isoform X2 [Beta vulgaris subsp. vulgaris]|uniref:protein SET DOMAIN GROUP 41 isoform X2 n=1 Tax=Beta vulgaris subsp. vulgaris TaxID=3555 RepID=UPI00053F666C|nr:protein SET DOMAIN GROUP 41 isoform X2 [Beta vulgaris subsp. vulgaris]